MGAANFTAKQRTPALFLLQDSGVTWLGSSGFSVLCGFCCFAVDEPGDLIEDRPGENLSAISQKYYGSASK